MRTDKLTKVLLGVIAIALWMIALNPWLRPAPAAAARGQKVAFACTGELTANAWGGTESSIGGYEVDLDCE